MSGEKRGRGRPPVGDRVVVRLPAAWLAEVDAIAARDGAKRAAVLRRLIRSALDQEVNP